MAQKYITLVDEVDNVPHDFDYSDYYRLLLPRDTRTHGFMTADTVEKMPWNQSFTVDHRKRTVQLDLPISGEASSTTWNTAFQEVINAAIEQDHFDVLHGNHSEKYQIQGSRLPLNIERFTVPLFGIASRGAHMTAYTRSSTGEMLIWIPRRSAHLFTYPGKLDTTVAGGVKAEHTPLECIVEESDEEATLPRDFVTKNVRSIGVITYMTRNRKNGRIHPDVLYVFDLELPPDIKPRPNDGEVSEFQLMSVEAVKEAMFKGEFKANCNLVMIDFFIRHGIITPNNEGDYMTLQDRLHRKLPIPTTPEQE